MRRPTGYAMAYRDGHRTEEHDTFSCAHCGNEFFVRPGVDPTTPGAITNVRPGPEHQGVGGVCLQCKNDFDRGLLCPKCEKEQSAGGGEAKPGEIVISSIGAVGKCRNFERRLEAYERRSAFRRAVDGFAP